MQDSVGYLYFSWSCRAPFAETPASKDSYETTDLGRAIEKADYKMGEDGGVIAFIVANKDKNIQLQFIGDRTYKTAMQPNDRKAIAELTELARILSGMEQILSLIHI